MKITNKSNKIIGMNGFSILPGETAECPAAYENNPVVQKYISQGIFEKAEEEKPGDQEAPAKALTDMTKEELIAYAQEHNIDIGNATTEAGILKKIQDAQKGE